MSNIFKFLLIFFALSVTTNLILYSSEIPFGDVDFWNKHGIFFLFFITLFPRLTLLFSSVATGGLFWWLGWIFAPRFLVAILATMAYWHTNPILVTIAWLVCLGGETQEKQVFVNRTYVYRQKKKSYDGDDSIETEYKVVD